MKLGFSFIVIISGLYSAEIEQTLKNLLPYTEIKEVITARNQPAMYEWIIKQKQTTEQNKKTLLHLALGLNPKNGIPSGFFSLEAIKLITSHIQDTVLKNAFEWLEDIIVDIKMAMPKWDKPENRTKLSMILNEYPLFSLSAIEYKGMKLKNLLKVGDILSVAPSLKNYKTIHDNLTSAITCEQKKLEEEINGNILGENFGTRLKKYGTSIIYNYIANMIKAERLTRNINGESIEKNEIYDTAALFFRLSRSPIGYTNIGSFILENNINTDMNGNPLNEENRFEEAAKCFRIGKTSSSYRNLGLMMLNNLIKTDMDGNPLNEEKRFEESAKCFRKSNTSDSFNDLGCLIKNKKIKTDMDGNPLKEENRFEEAAKCFRKSNTPDALHNLGYLLINDNIIHTDMDGNPLNEEKRFEESAKCFRKSNTPDALYNLGVLIMREKIHTDINGKVLNEQNCFEEAAKCFRKSNVPDALHNLGVLITNKKINTDMDGNLFDEQNRFEEAALCYRSSKLNTSYNNLANLILKNFVKTDEEGNPITNEDHKFLTIKRLYELSGNDPTVHENLSLLYLEYHFGLTNIQRLERIKELLENSDTVKKNAILEFTYSLLYPIPTEEFDLWKNMLLSGIYTDNLLRPEEDYPECIPSESEDHHEEKSVSPTKVLLSIEEQLERLNSNESTQRSELLENENDQFLKILKYFHAFIEKYNRILENKKRRIDILRESTNPKKELHEKRYQLKFTEKACEQFRRFNKTERERFRILVDAIQNDDKTGNVEILGHVDCVNGRRVITRELTKADRFAYTLDPDSEIIYVLSLRKHYKN